MKVAILAGGLGTRMSEETVSRPKPMVEIGGMPILWHIMKNYAAVGFKEFVIALGYKGEIIKDFFLNYRYHSHHLTIQLKNGNVTVHNGLQEDDWTIHLIDTGLSTLTGGRVRQIADFIGSETFMLTYGDGVSNINLLDLLKFHREHGKLATVTAVRPPARFGGIEFNGDQVVRFQEKPQVGEGWINGGFFVLEPSIAKYIPDDMIPWERGPMEHLAADGQLIAYRHEGFWQCMDTLRDMKYLEELWQQNKAPWKVW